ncbi:MaoC family dehydratase [Jiulongibacter sediminis]|jgi:acyl dehydratase|uniref:Dehydrogenase n=1 Tax=Jiulongibacter sediminis TaxID=1605367 RepID=A0A0N8HAF5_9BACT|nr:MaoC family dehydratase [Jiulongibacter sediminis]KPM50028.1 dehydrogenase [Jiulongibacter sediminis]TBX27056.1 dehydrogenase [Jiulongibacter sediminis]
MESKKIPVGSTYKFTFSFSQEQVNTFADLTGDHNPIHVDPEYAATTRFGKPIIHGHLSSSVFTKFLGMNEPGGPGSIYLKQETEYLRPMFVGKDYEVVFKVMNIKEGKHIAEIATEVYDPETGKITIRGTGTLKNTELY